MFPQSLVKYESPRLVTTHSDGFDIFEVKKSKDGRRSPHISEDLESEEETEMETEETVELLDILLPPRKHEEGGKLWIQRVSRTPATDSDVLNLQDQFDKELTRREAREIGICPVRQDLYAQCFDELIRQEIIACPERGELYKRIRNETQMTVNTLRKVYESNIAYGIKKVLASAKHSEDTKTKLKELVTKKEDVVRKLATLERQLEHTESTLKAKQDALAKTFEEEQKQLNEKIELQMLDMADFLNKDFLEYDTE